MTIKPNLHLGHTKSDKKMLNKKKDDLNVNFKTVSGQRGSTIRPLVRILTSNFSHHYLDCG